MTIKISYKDKVRDVVVIHKPSDNYLMFDLSEFDKSEQEYYEAQFTKLHQKYLEDIKELGLNGNYRYFNKEKIEWLDKETT